MGLADERLAAPFVGVPEGEVAAMKFTGFILQPGHDLETDVATFHPGVLAMAEGQLPKRAHHDQQQQRRAGEAGEEWAICSALVVFNHVGKPS